MNIIEKALRKKNKKTGEGSLSVKNNNNVVFDEVRADTESSIPVINSIESLGNKTSKRAESIVESFFVNRSVPAANKVVSHQVEISAKHLTEQGILTSNDERSTLSEEFRRIKHPLLQNIKGKSAHVIEKANVIQVTSSRQGEGKTFNAINLAMSMTMELDYKVLLIDGDVLKPSVSKVLNIETDKGLIDYLSGDVKSLSDVLVHTNIPKLTLLPAGNKHSLSAELFSSDIMIHLFTDLSERYSDRVIIIDSPPILQTNESAILAQNVGQIVFVVEQNATELSNIQDAVRKLPEHAVVGIVMNKSRLGTKTGYGYGYGAE